MKKFFLLVTAIVAMPVLFSCNKENNGGNEGDQTVKPVADFEFAVETNTGNVQFTNKSKEAESYEWDFGDESHSYSAEENPSFTYDVSGTYTVSLTAIKGNEVDVVKKEVVILLPEKKTVNITIDGNIDDWAEIPFREDLECGGEILKIKTAATKDHVYVLIKGTEKLITNASRTAVGFDMDYNMSTGWANCPILKDKKSGADVMQEIAGFHVWGWRAEESQVGWDWIKDGWLEYATDKVIDGATYKEWKLDLKYARAQVMANPVFNEAPEEIQKSGQFATTVSEEKIRMYIWLRNEGWNYVASAPKEGGEPFDVVLGEYVEGTSVEK